MAHGQCPDHPENPVYKGETYFNRREYAGKRTATYKDKSEWMR